MAELICILQEYFRWPYQLLIAFVLFLDPENIGFAIKWASFGHVFTELCLKTEFRIMAELICIVWANCLCLNQFLTAFIVLLDHENIGLSLYSADSVMF